MNIFEKHFAMLKDNQNIFEKYKTMEKVGIEIPEQKQIEYFKFGKELLTSEIINQFMEVRSIYYHNVVMKKLNEYTFSEWFVCLNEKVLLDYAIPIFSRVLYNYPMLCGINCEWEILYEITKIESEFWQERKEWKCYFQTMINDAIEKYERGVLESMISSEYIHQFKLFKSV